MHEPCLQWVLVAGETRHVSEFANLIPGLRPEASCPVCGKPVIFKLGNERIHHAAHHEDAICAATQPETAIHLNSKYHIQKELSATKSLKLWHRCAGWTFEQQHYGCHKDIQQALEYARDWNRVEVEWPYGKYRLDVALLRDDRVVCAIEVLVTHPSEEGKIEYLKQQGLAWAEIRVTPDSILPQSMDSRDAAQRRTLP
jgi:hypothetical protein